MRACHVDELREQGAAGANVDLEEPSPIDPQPEGPAPASPNLSKRHTPLELTAGARRAGR